MSFVPNATQQRTEQETVQQSLQDLQSGSTRTVIWPTHMTCQKLISNYTYVIDTDTRYARPNDVYVTLVI